MEESGCDLRANSLEMMAEGIAFLNAGKVKMAESAFREACELRDRMAWREEAEAAWMRAAAWIHYGDAILRRDDWGRFPEALAAMEKCIEALERLVLEENPKFLEQMVLALIHKGSALGQMARGSEAEDAFGQAERLLRTGVDGGREERLRLAGMLMVNRARARLRNGWVTEAVVDARRGVGIFNAVADAAAAVRARAVFCEALAALLDVAGGLEGVEDWIAEATDAVEEALAILRETGISEDRAADLVRYGAKIYRVCQPMFLGEFLTEWLTEDGPLAGDAELRAEMLGELLLAKVAVERRVLRRAHETDFVKAQMVVLAKLQAGETALNQG